MSFSTWYFFSTFKAFIYSTMLIYLKRAIAL
uniref:Uncharacterized protein n=1 Tax=Siphoviridae sp. ctX581 TaxID=2826365 RepID=A0A8S5MDN8_9CAUD|nr:MAG TPA: hypothetical protein [Siphoviridae sp. ctX581]